MIGGSYPWLTPDGIPGDLNSLFVTTAEIRLTIDRRHTCFGQVYEGLEVIDAIRQGDEIIKIVITEENE